MIDIEQEVRRALKDMLDSVDPAPFLPPQTVRRARTRRVLFAGLTGVTLIVVVAAASWGALALRRDLSQSIAPQPSSSPSDPWAKVPSGWSSLPPPPLAARASARAWTGEELILWSGYTYSGGTAPPKGVAYSPRSGEWREIAPSPLSGRYQIADVWTGRELLIWGGVTDSGEAAGDGAAYDPKSDSWRMLAESPLSPRVPLATVWTGDEMIVWGSTARTQTIVDGTAYDPVADRWRSLAPAPVEINLGTAVWTGEEMIVYGSLLDNRNVSDTGQNVGAVYDPASDGWTVMAESRLSPQATTMDWTGTKALVWDYLLDAALYDPRTDVWEPVDDVPLDESECYPSSAATQGFVLAWYCGQAALFDASSGSWKEIPHPDEGLRVAARDVISPVQAGSVFVLPGITGEEGGGGVAWVYKP